MTAIPYVLLDDSLTPGGRSLLYSDPVDVVAVSRPGRCRAGTGRDRGRRRGGAACRRASSPTSSAIASSRDCASLLPESRERAALLDRPVRRRRSRSTMPPRAPGWRRMAAPNARRSRICNLSWSREEYARAFAEVLGLHRRRRRLSDQPDAQISLCLRRRSGRALCRAPPQAAGRLRRADRHAGARRAVVLAGAVLPPRRQAHVDAVR